MVLDQLNTFLRPHGYCFGPDVAGMNLEAGAAQRLRHSVTHGAQANYPCHCLHV